MKNFVAPDMRTALKMVREALGADAVILANRRIPGGIELLATNEPVEMPPPAPRAVAAASLVAGAATPGPAAATAAVPKTAVAGVAAAARSAAFPDMEPQSERRSDAGWWQMQQELRSMRDLIEQQLAGFAWQQFRTRQPAEAAMWRRLQRLGLQPAVMRELLAEYDSSARAATAWQQLMSRLTARLPITGVDPVAAGGAYALIGPTGAGKSTTIAKLAARHVLAHGHEDIGLVTLDNYRIGAHEQLRTLARILNVPLKVATPADLPSVLYELRHCRLVLIDTAGLHGNSRELQQQLDALNALGDRIQCLQVLAANAQQQVLKSAHRVYQTSNLAGCVLTKIDEAGTLGEVLSLLIQSRTPLLYTTDGQAIPNDLAVAAAKPLVARTIELAKQVECDEEQLATLFGMQQRSMDAARSA